jgi:hypothetical protein
MITSGSNCREFLFDVAGAAAAAWLESHGLELRAIAAYAASDFQFSRGQRMGNSIHSRALR